MASRGALSRQEWRWAVGIATFFAQLPWVARYLLEDSTSPPPLRNAVGLGPRPIGIVVSLEGRRGQPALRPRQHAASSAPRAWTRPRKDTEVRYLRPPPLGDVPQAHPIAARSGGRPHAREGTPPPQRLPVGRPRPVRKGARNPPSPQNRMAGTVPAQSKRCPPLRTTLRGPTAEWSRSRRAGAPGTVNSAAFLPCPPRQPGRLGATRPTDSLTPGRAPPSLARHTPLTRNPASLFPRPSPPRPLKSAKGTGSPAVDPEEIRSCIPPRDFARSSGRVVATGRPGRATLLQRRRTATSVSASSQASLSVVAQPLRRWLRARSQGAAIAATCACVRSRAAPLRAWVVRSAPR